MRKRSDFLNRIKLIVKPKKSEVEEEKKYGGYDIVIVEDQIDGNTFICRKQKLESNQKYTTKISANNIEDGSQIAEYKLNALPAGRACFGGYTDKECNKGKKIYSFEDVWYKIYGKFLELGKEFTKSELLAILPEMKEKFKDAKYGYIYFIKSKDDDIKCLTQYLSKKNSKVKMLEIIDSQYILTDSYIMDIEIPEFKIEEIKSMGISRVYSKARFTKEACTQIIENYERSVEQETR